MRPVIAAMTLGTCLFLVAPSAGQSLAEVSRATEAARKATTDRPPARVYTNTDLPAVDRPADPDPPGASPEPSASTPASQPAESPTPATGTPQLGVSDEAYWRDRMRPLRERLDRARAVADETKRQADALSRAADQCFRIGVVCADYTESLRLLEQHKGLVADVARAERAVAALEEEARRAGAPPGWLRP